MSNTAVNPLNEFIKLLQLTINPDNQLRKTAENHLNNIDQETKLNFLLQTLVSNSSSEILEIAAVTMRRTIDKLGNINKLSPAAISSLKTALPQLCLQQTDPNIRGKYVFIISAMFDLCIDDPTYKWPELSGFFYDCLVRSNHDVGIEISLRLLDASPAILTQFPDDHFPNVMKIICETLTRDPKIYKKLVIMAVKGFSSIAIDISFAKIQAHLDAPLKILLHVVSNTSEMEIVSEILKEFNVITECRSRVLKNHAQLFVNTMLGLLSSQHYSNEIRIEVMECIVTLSEQSPKTFKSKLTGLLPQIVDVFIRHITLLQEDPQWAFSTSEDGEDDEDNISTSAETSLDRLTCAIGGKLMLPIIINQVTPLLSSKVWQHRCAALISISCTAEGCKKQIKPSLSKLLELIIPYIKDPHPRVVFCCINCVGQMAMDFIGHFHQHFHEQIFPAIFYASENYGECPRVQAHAICCFINLMDGCPKKVLDMYADHFFNRLRALFVLSVNSLNKPGIPMVLENTLSSLDKFAESTGESFEKYYNHIAPDLILLIRSFIKTPHIKFFIMTLDTLASVLVAVGQNKCTNELHSVLDIVKQFEINSIKSINTEENYMLQYLEIIAKIAQVLGDSFEPILPTFMPKLMELVSTPIENSMLSSTHDAFDPKAGPEADGFKKLVSAHTDALGEKYRAINILQQIIDNMKNSMSNHVEQIMDIMIKNLIECYDDDIQTSACEMFPVLLKSSQSKGVNFMLQLWFKLFTAFYMRITNNDGYFTSDKAFECIRECLDVVGYQGLSQDIIFRIIELMNFEIVRLVKEFGNKVTPNLLDEDPEDYEDADKDDSYDDNEESDIIMSIQVLHEKLFKILKENFLPFFQNLFDNILLLMDCRNVDFRFYGIAMISDLVENCPADSFSLQDKFFPKIVEGLLCDNPSVAQTSCFVVGMMAEHGSHVYQAHLSQCLSQLQQVITRPNSKDDAFSSITANAVASFGRIMKFCPSVIQPPLDTAISCWISWLPVIEDEVDFVLGYLLELIETNYQLVAGVNNCQLIHVLDSIAHMIPYADEPVSNKSVLILSQFKMHFPDIFNNWFNNLSQTLKDNLEYAKEASME